MKHLFIVNPTAGGKDKSITVSRAVRAAFENRDGEYEVYITKAPMDAADKIRAEAAVHEHLRVYACGGDGTFNECVCGAALLDNVAVAPYPTGTGNDFCRMFGEEKDLFRDLNALLGGTEHPIDLIDCNGRYSANICSVGIDARIGTEVHQYTGLPLIGGTGGYIVSAVVNSLRGINRPMRVQSPVNLRCCAPATGAIMAVASIPVRTRDPMTASSISTQFRASVFSRLQDTLGSTLPGKPTSARSTSGICALQVFTSTSMKRASSMWTARPSTPKVLK